MIWLEGGCGSCRWFAPFGAVPAERRMFDGQCQRLSESSQRLDDAAKGAVGAGPVFVKHSFACAEFEE